MINNTLGAVMLDIEGVQLQLHEIKTLRHPAVGGVILFARNFENKTQVSALIDEIRAIRTPLLIAVDQEGGRVQRFQTGFQLLPPMASLGRLFQQDPTSALNSAQSIGRVMAKELVDCGVDFSFAPVLDLSEAPSAVIGDRALDGDPNIITDLASALIVGMNSAGMQATGKHFPGHGNVSGDSHLETPVDKRSLADIRAHDMRPFKALSQQLGAVMTAHIHYPQIDANLPTFSAYWLQEILRQELGFNGVIFSDDLSMEGALLVGNIEQRCQKALMAGCDMVLVCNAPDQAERALACCTKPLSTLSQQRLMAMQKATIRQDSVAQTWNKDLSAVHKLA